MYEVVIYASLIVLNCMQAGATVVMKWTSKATKAWLACASSYKVNSPKTNMIKWCRVLMLINARTTRNIWNVLRDTLMSFLKEWRNSYNDNFLIFMNKESVFCGSPAHLRTVGRTLSAVSACPQFANICYRHLWESVSPVIAITWIKVPVSS